MIVKETQAKNVKSSVVPHALNNHFSSKNQHLSHQSITKSSSKVGALKPGAGALHTASQEKNNVSGALLGKITEIITSDEQESSLTMLLPLLATLSKDERWFAWVSPPKNLPKSLLQEAGIALDKVMLLYPDDQNSALNLAKKALSAGTCHAVISWSGGLSEHELNHLEHSAKIGASHGILIRSRQKQFF